MVCQSKGLQPARMRRVSRRAARHEVSEPEWLRKRDDMGESLLRRGLVWRGSRPKQSEESVYTVWLPNVRYQNPKGKESVHIWQVTQAWKSEFESSEDTIP